MFLCKCLTNHLFPRLQLDCEQSPILAMAIVGRAKYTRARTFEETRREGSAENASRLLEILRVRVYFVRPTIAIAKIRDYSQSSVIKRTSRRIKQVNKIRRCVLLTSCHFKKVKKTSLFFFLKCDFRSFILQSERFRGKY